MQELDFNAVTPRMYRTQASLSDWDGNPTPTYRTKRQAEWALPLPTKSVPYTVCMDVRIDPYIPYIR